MFKGLRFLIDVDLDQSTHPWLSLYIAGIGVLQSEKWMPLMILRNYWVSCVA
jgi:hypothetical protein